MWPESCVSTVNLAKTLLLLKRYRIFPRTYFFSGTPCIYRLAGCGGLHKWVISCEKIQQVRFNLEPEILGCITSQYLRESCEYVGGETSIVMYSTTCLEWTTETEKAVIESRARTRM